MDVNNKSVSLQGSSHQHGDFNAFEDTKAELRLLSSQPMSCEFDLEQIRNCFPELFDAASIDELTKPSFTTPSTAIGQTDKLVGERLRKKEKLAKKRPHQSLDGSRTSSSPSSSPQPQRRRRTVLQP